MSDDGSTAPRVIVVGAGIIGASIAWHLSRQGAVVTILAGKSGGEATPNSFAWINAGWGNPEPYYRLRMRSIQAWKRIAEALPSIPLSWCGGLCWDLPPGQLEAYAVEHGGWGYDIQPVDRQQSAIIEPNLIEPPAFALHARIEGTVEPVAATRIMLGDAFRLGATQLIGTEVKGLVRKGGKVMGVETAEGTLLADHVVLAAGTGTAAIAATAGIDIPLHSPPGLIVHSRPHAKILNGLVIGPQLHMRQTDEGRIIAGGDFGGSDPGKNPQQAADALFVRMKAMLHGAENLELETYTIGHRPTPADGFPIIGPADGIQGLYVAVMHSGITLAPLVGQLAADEILHATHDDMLARFRLSRFSGTQAPTIKPGR